MSIHYMCVYMYACACREREREMSIQSTPKFLELSQPSSWLRLISMLTNNSPKEFVN